MNGDATLPNQQPTRPDGLLQYGMPSPSSSSASSSPMLTLLLAKVRRNPFGMARNTLNSACRCTLMLFSSRMSTLTANNMNATPSMHSSATKPRWTMIVLLIARSTW